MNSAMRCLYFGVTALAITCCVVGYGAAQDADEETATDVGFSQLLESESPTRILQDNPALKKAYETWQGKLEEVKTGYLKSLERLRDKEKKGGDIEFQKLMEEFIAAATKQPLPHVVFTDISVPKTIPVQQEMNKAKSKVNKIYVTTLSKAVSTAIKQDKVEEAKEITDLLYASFLPPSVEIFFPKIKRFENKAFLFVEDEKDWDAADHWCRERDGTLTCIRNPAEQAFLLGVKTTSAGNATTAWIGGFLSNNKWYWSDGTPFVYANWGKGEPSGGTQTHLLMGGGNGGPWDDDWKTRQWPFIIQWTFY